VSHLSSLASASSPANKWPDLSLPVVNPEAVFLPFPCTSRQTFGPCLATHLPCSGCIAKGAPVAEEGLGSGANSQKVK
jgi:hypothetical protein